MLPFAYYIHKTEIKSKFLDFYLYLSKRTKQARIRQRKSAELVLCAFLLLETISRKAINFFCQTL